MHNLIDSFFKTCLDPKALVVRASKSMQLTASSRNLFGAPNQAHQDLRAGLALDRNMTKSIHLRGNFFYLYEELIMMRRVYQAMAHLLDRQR